MSDTSVDEITAFAAVLSAWAHLATIRALGTGIDRWRAA